VGGGGEEKEGETPRSPRKIFEETVLNSSENVGKRLTVGK